MHLFAWILAIGFHSNKWTLSESLSMCFDPTPVESFPQTVFQAEARKVPFPAVNTTLKLQFLKLFRRNSKHVHDTPQDATTADCKDPSPMDQDAIDEINNLCPRDAFFYSFAPRHQQAIMLLRNHFMNQTSAESLYELAKIELYRHDFNWRVWYYALVQTFLMRPDLNGYYLAWQLDAMPDLYIPGNLLNLATMEAKRPSKIPEVDMCHQNQESIFLHPVLIRVDKPKKNITRKASKLQNKQKKEGKRRIKRQLKLDCIVYDGVRGATDIRENRLWYFREDVMVNQHHWNWHQYYPLSSLNHGDRRGELFFYNHHFFVARYNAERLSNGLRIETALPLHLGGNIGEGYASGLVDKQSNKFWTNRWPNTPLNDVNHQNDPDFQLDIPIPYLSYLHERLENDIYEGYLLANRTLHLGRPPVIHWLPIRNQEGLGDLANTVEAVKELSTFPEFYDALGIHNLGHLAIGLSADPDFICKSPPGVMADTTTAMRDPAFYKLHTLVDDIYFNYKDTLPPYHPTEGEWPLIWKGVSIINLETVVRPYGFRNLLWTYWSVHRSPLEQGIDGSIHEGDVDKDICYLHLDHEPFIFKLEVVVNACAQSTSGKGIVRIFMAPRYDLDGRRFSMVESRHLMFQLDSFPVQLHRGRNVIIRNSRDSSSTKPWSRSLQDMLRDPNNGGETEWCGCGWPDHLYIPKGNSEGMEFDLFAMITSYDEDQIEDDIEDLKIPEPCKMPFMYCGIPYRKYPDSRPMGYPFDRQPFWVAEDSGDVRPVNVLEEYVEYVPNMASSVVVIKHVNYEVE